MQGGFSLSTSGGNTGPDKPHITTVLRELVIAVALSDLVAVE